MKGEFNFWNHHSRNYLEMAFRADRHETLASPDGHGFNKGVCGDSVEMFVTVKEGRIETVTFRVNGCMNTNACANTVAHLAEGKTLEEAWEITPQDVIDFLETLPEQSTHCAELAVGAFYLALRNLEEGDAKAHELHSGSKEGSSQV
ncbi:MAG: iron-sulfur cluster assembly scaffold protein [Deltaproteobacteria bacterium]|nr:iron-sulfur cluster assembly scaffold protein [Deltaproteobacteria bacterium]MBW2017734.1 iron-sulfur cluster assembly scaffold protein [Deltaproteobacteria bacterium]MBW2128871.1 iron-sulfur cluster assembly scaffold protein [Deltaproteobacteria bacterium]MBW2304458.1 iron-sulfur cluster assembly scaffold protein [Deltaproteobacteria bacterium]